MTIAALQLASEDDKGAQPLPVWLSCRPRAHHHRPSRPRRIRPHPPSPQVTRPRKTNQPFNPTPSSGSGVFCGRGFQPRSLAERKGGFQPLLLKSKELIKLFHEKDRILHLQHVSIMDTLTHDRHGNPGIYAGSPCVNWGGKPL